MEIISCGSKAYNVQHQKFVDSHRWPKFKTLRGAPVVYPPTLHRFVLGPFSDAVRIASMPAFIHSFIQPAIHSFSQSASHSFVHPSIGRHTPAYHPFFHCKFNAESSQALFRPLTTPDLSPILISSKGCDDKGYRKDSRSS